MSNATRIYIHLRACIYARQPASQLLHGWWMHIMAGVHRESNSCRSLSHRCRATLALQNSLSNSFTAAADRAFAIVGNLHCRSTRTFACRELNRESRSNLPRFELPSANTSSTEYARVEVERSVAQESVQISLCNRESAVNRTTCFRRVDEEIDTPRTYK